MGKRKGRRPRAERFRPQLESLEERRLLTWVATFVNSTGALTIEGVGLSSDTGVLKVDPNSGEILLDGNNSGNFVDTGANLATITTTIQIEANTTVNSNFIIDNNAGAFFEAPSVITQLALPLFNYTGSTALDPNTSFTVRGVAGVADTFEVAPSATAENSGQVVLTEPPNQLNQQNKLTITYGPNTTIPNSTGITGKLVLDGIDGTGGNDKLYIDDQGATINPSVPGAPTVTGVASDWTLNGNSITGPAFPAAATVPPTPPPAPGTVGSISYTNIANLTFNDNTAGDVLTVNSVAANTTASDGVANTTQVNYNQPLAFPLNIQGIQGTPEGTLDIVGAAGGNNSFYIDASSVSLAPAGTKPVYNTPFTHSGAQLTYTVGSLKELQVAGNGGNNDITVQVPPILIAPYVSQTLPATFIAYGGALPPVIANTTPTPVAPGTNLLRVLGNAPGALTTGADTITVNDLAGTATGGTAGTDNIEMSGITAVVIYGNGGNDTLTNDSTGNKAQGLAPVPALLIGGSGNDTLTGGAGSDMFLGGGGQDTLISKTVSTVAAPTTTYFFPHQDQFGNIYDQLLNPAVGDTTSTLTGAGGNQVVVTGAVDPALSVTGVGDLDTGNLATAGIGGTGGGGGNLGNGGQTQSSPTVPPGNVTAPLYMVTPALTDLEEAMGIVSGSFPANEAAVLEFGKSLNLGAQFASAAAFVGRAYNDFLVDRGGGGVFGQPVKSSGGTTGGGGTGSLLEEGVSLVSTPEIDYWVGQINQGLPVQSMQAQLLASPELRQTLPGSAMWVRFLYEAVTGQLPTDAELSNDDALLAASDTTSTRYALAFNLLESPSGQASEIEDAYANVVPGGGGPTTQNLTAIQADLAAGETLPQVALTMAQSNGNYLNYEEANDVGVIGFVATVYQDVLHRAAGAGDLLYWASVRGAGASDAAIAQTIADSPEARTFIVDNAYQTYLGRAPDAGGLSFWLSQLSAGMSDEVFVSLIASSAEYYADNGGTSSGYITALYRDILQRTSTPSQPEIDYWVTQLARSTRGAAQARADIALAFQESTEYRTLLIDSWYQSFDGRAPTAAELSSALSLFASGASDEAVEAQILVAKQ
ncbi:MAG TPA: DUF4214 domain-containing protein [Pirellulales bacterium]|nr:DUF4214 domain-containing protein [Pirellulales bacterium]